MFVFCCLDCDVVISWIKNFECVGIGRIILSLLYDDWIWVEVFNEVDVR